MKDQHAALHIAELNGGILTASMARENGISGSSLRNLVDQGQLEKVQRGIYRAPGSWDDEFFLLQQRFPRGIFALESALFLHGLADTCPYHLHLAFPRGYNASGVRNSIPGGVDCHFMKPEWYGLGVCEVKSPTKRTIRTYDPERTLCDIVRPRNHMSKDIIVFAFQEYARDCRRRNIPKLDAYAKELRVTHRIGPYLEVLL